MSEKTDLKTRVDQFNALSLPGQPMVVHMGTSYLINDLWREVEKLQRAIGDLASEKLRRVQNEV